MDMLRRLMGNTGFQTTYNEISGQAQDTEGKDRTMPSTATKRRLAICLFALSSIVGAADQNVSSPRYILDPLLGVRLPLTSANLDTLPEQVRALCVQIADNPTWTGRQWIFGSAKEGETSYYLVGGYFIRKQAVKGESTIFQPEQGGVYEVKGQTCGGDPAREVFEVRDAAQIPHAVLQRLAHDFASRLSRTVGGDAQLREALRKQHIDVGKLSPELRQAFEPFATRAPR